MFIKNISVIPISFFILNTFFKNSLYIVLSVFFPVAHHHVTRGNKGAFTDNFKMLPP